MILPFSETFFVYDTKFNANVCVMFLHKQGGGPDTIA